MLNDSSEKITQENSLTAIVASMVSDMTTEIIANIACSGLDRASLNSADRETFEAMVRSLQQANELAHRLSTGRS